MAGVERYAREGWCSFTPMEAFWSGVLLIFGIEWQPGYPPAGEAIARHWWQVGNYLGAYLGGGDR